VPIKATDFYFKPTLKVLQERFISNEPLRSKHKVRLKNVIDLPLLQRRHSLTTLEAALKAQGVNLVLRRSENGLLYGVTYVDVKTRCVFNGSVLEKAYSARAFRKDA
jgi:hypothetical protein